MIAQALLLLTSTAMYGALNALRLPGGVLASILVAALLTFVAILGHELAHAAAAHLVGARIRAIVALPVRLRLHPPRLDLIRRGGRGDLGGYVSYTLDRIDARRKHAIIAAAGPLANLVLALLAGTMAAGLDQRPTTPVDRDTATVAAIHAGRLPSDEEVRQWLARRPVIETPAPAWPTLLFAFALLSGGLGLANLIPYGGSDGDRILDLWRWRKRLRQHSVPESGISCAALDICCLARRIAGVAPPSPARTALRCRLLHLLFLLVIFSRLSCWRWRGIFLSDCSDVTPRGVGDTCPT